MSEVCDKALEFKKKYPSTIVWRLKKHVKVIEDYIDPDEEIIYVFAGQKNEKWYDVTSSCIVALTNKRLMIGQKRVVWGSFFTQVTPDMYNDMQIYKGLFFGKITIDTVKELIVITDLDKASLDEIETNISNFMMKEKKKYNIER